MSKVAKKRDDTAAEMNIIGGCETPCQRIRERLPRVDSNAVLLFVGRGDFSRWRTQVPSPGPRDLARRRLQRCQQSEQLWRCRWDLRPWRGRSKLSTTCVPLSRWPDDTPRHAGRSGERRV